MAIGIERDALGVTVEGGFHSDELRIHVVGGGLGHCRQCIRRYARPGAYTDVNALREGVGAEICAPRPTGHVALDRRVERIDADFAVAA